MAQQVHYPSDTLHPGLMYYFTPQNCALFGVCCKAIPWQINYFIDEAMDVGKRSNTIVSLLHHFFEMHGLGDVQVHLHADNCVDLYKTNTCGRVLSGLHSNVTLSFMVVGHTKFSPDCYLGLLKQHYRRTRVGCLDDVVKVVEELAICNIAHLVRTQDGETVVPTHDWAAMIGRHLQKINGKEKYHHFRISSSTPDVVHVHERLMALRQYSTLA